MPATPNSQSSSRATRVNRVTVLLRSGEGARALQAIGDRWSFLILRDAFLGISRFEDLRRLTGAARGTLAARLNSLVDQGVMYRNPYGLAPSRLEYRLTAKGLALYSVALSLWNWESRWAGEFGLPPRLLHKSCGKAMHPRLVCTHCREQIKPHDVEFEVGPGARHYSSGEPGERRRRSLPADAAVGVDTTMFHSIDTIGDRWSGLLLAALYFGLHRYDDISAAMGIATNILADRLRRLLAAGAIEQHLYQDRPPRHEYRLTAKGWDLYPFVIALHDWATAWVPSPFGPGLKLRHRLCAHTLRSMMSCDQCDAAVDPREVGIKATRKWQESRLGGAVPARKTARRRPIN